MIKHFLTFLSIVALASCSTFHNYTKKEAIEVAKKRNINIVIEDNDKILKVLTRDSNYRKLDEIYQFNDAGKQVKYSIIAFAEECFQDYLLKEINNDAYKWKKLNDSTYISKYNLKRYLNVHKSTFSFDIVQHDLSRNEYENLIK